MDVANIVCNNILNHFSFNSINRPAVNEVAEHITPFDWTFSEIQILVDSSSKVIKRKHDKATFT